MKAYQGRRGIDPLISNLCRRRRWVLSFKPRPLYTRERIPNTQCIEVGPKGRYRRLGEQKNVVFFIVAPCILIVLSPLFVQLKHKNYYKIVKQLKSFKIIIIAPTCFGLHKPSSWSSLPVLRLSYNADFGYIYRYLRLSVLWLHMQPKYR